MTTHDTGTTSSSIVKGTPRSFSFGKRWLQYINLAAVIFLAFYILVVGNIIVYRHPHRVDLTAEKLHTLSDETVRRLALIEEEILVVMPILFRPDDPINPQIFMQARNLLNQYIALQPNIRLEAELSLQSQEDSLRWVEIREKYHLTKNQLNSFIFISAADESLWQVVPLDECATIELEPPKIVSIDAESAFTAALTKLIRKERSKVYFTRDWGELSTEDANPGGIARFIEELEANSYAVEQLSLLETKAVPADCDLLVIMSPSRNLQPSDQAKIHDYLINGGRLLVTLGPVTRGLEKILDEWGIRIPPGRVFQKQQFLGGVFQWSNVVIARKSNRTHPITRDFTRGAFEVFGSHVRPIETAFKENLVTDMLIATERPAEGSKQGAFIDRNNNRSLDDDEELGEITWGVAMQRVKPDRPPPRYRHLPTRIVVLGDGSPLTNAWIDRFSHRDLGLNSVRWLLGTEREIGTSGDEWVSRKITWSEEIASFLFWIPIFLFPGIVLSVGTFIYFLRRS